MRVRDGVGSVVEIVQVARENEIRYPAAALAYYGFVSFVPFLMFVFAILGRELAIEISRTAPQFLTPKVLELVNRSLRTAAGKTGGGLLAFGVLLWTSANVVGDIRTVIKRIEGPGRDGLEYLVRDTVVILGSLGIAIVAILATSILFALPPTGPLVEFGGFVWLLIALTSAFVPLYYFPSKLVSSPRRAIPGALTASFGWAIIHTVIHFYATHAGKYAVYGVLSGIIIILTGLYLAAVTLLIGFVVNARIQMGHTDRSRARDGHS